MGSWGQDTDQVGMFDMMPSLVFAHPFFPFKVGLALASLLLSVFSAHRLGFTSFSGGCFNSSQTLISVLFGPNVAEDCVSMNTKCR